MALAVLKFGVFGCRSFFLSISCLDGNSASVLGDAAALAFQGSSWTFMLIFHRYNGIFLRLGIGIRLSGDTHSEL